MKANIFDIDYQKFIILLSPPDLRKPKWLLLLQSFILPVRSVYGVFTNNRQNNLYKLMHNGQVCYLRKALNDAFDPSLRRIYIDDGNRFKRPYIYTSGEMKPNYLGAIYLQPSSSYADTGLDFKVIVPQGYNIEAVRFQMQALINFYKLASKRYTIEHE